MPRPLAQNALMKPLVALAVPGMYLVYKYNQYKRQQQEASRRKAAEKELLQLNYKIDKLLNKLDEHEPEMAMTQEEECVICVHAKATMQTFPCGHRVVCRKCFVKTIQVAVSQRLLPLRCVVCRAKILRLRQARDVPFPTSVSQYSMTAASSRCMPTSISLYSFGSGSSGISGISNVSSASSNSGGSYYSTGIRGKFSRQIPTGGCNSVSGGNKRLQGKKVSSKSGARSKEPLKGLPQIHIDEYREIPCRPPPVSRPPRVHIRENKVAPQESLGRLPTIKEYTEFISDKEFEKEKSSSTRIRCAQKLVSQIEHHHHGIIPQQQQRIRSPRGTTSSSSSLSTAPSQARSHITVAVTSTTTASGTPRGTNNRTSSSSSRVVPPTARVLPRSPSTSSGSSSRGGTCSSDRKSHSGATMGRRESSSSAISLRSNVSHGSLSSVRSSASVKSGSSARSGSASLRGSVSSSRHGGPSPAKKNSSSSSGKNASTPAKSSDSNNKSSSSSRKDSEGKGVRRKDAADGKGGGNDKRGKTNKGESKIKALKKRFEGKEYHRLQ
ncbi:uncharacterized protein [Macrobrachium rosenbergii]|uniref:uncharacterized protein n=1 Tax=Macrobrachium rosenbergii TaxID=79674 RepID=UPI0034D75FAC